MTRQPTLDAHLELAQASGWDTLRGGVAQGLHSMPDAFIEGYDALLDLAAQPRPENTHAAYDAPTMAKSIAEAEYTDWLAARDRQAGQLFTRAGQSLNPRGEMIERYLAPALAEQLAAFATDVKTIGAHANKVIPDDAVVAEAMASSKFGEAWLRFTQSGAWYLNLRSTWLTLRQGDPLPEQSDPLSIDSLLAEVANAAEIRPDTWRTLRAFGPGWPTPVHTRLAAILADGGRMWMPSAREQHETFRAAVPEQTPMQRRADLAHPMKAITTP